MKVTRSTECKILFTCKGPYFCAVFIKFLQNGRLLEILAKFDCGSLSLGLEVGQQVKSYLQLVYTLHITFSMQSSFNLLRMFILTNFDHGWVGLESISLGQIKVKSCLHSRGHILSAILIKLLHDISAKFNHGSFGVKKKVTRSNPRKSLLTLQEPYFSEIFLKLAQKVSVDNISAKFDHESVWFKKQVIKSIQRKGLFTVYRLYFWCNLPQTCSGYLS